MHIDPSLPAHPAARPNPKKHHLDRRAAGIAEAAVGNADDLLTTGAVASWLGCSPQWLEIGRCRGYAPAAVTGG
jgi:hypothetical protein